VKRGAEDLRGIVISSLIEKLDVSQESVLWLMSGLWILLQNLTSGGSLSQRGMVLLHAC
jgi:hypothetical protein